MHEVRAFYDELASNYHLIYEDWWSSVERQGRALHALIESRLGPGPKRVLDCTCGIGTQTLGLSLHGHQLLGTDLSGVAIARASEEALARGLVAEFRVWDVRDLTSLEGGPFDVVLSADNSLSHLATAGELLEAARGMRTQTASKGAAVITLRDYEALLQAGVSTQGPRVYGEPGFGRRVIIQLWDWEDGGPVYNLEHIILTETSDGYRTSSHSCRCRALTRTEVEECFAEAGASSIEWLESEATGFYQPIMWVTWAD